MARAKKHDFRKWEVSIIELMNSKGSKFKVTRRLPELNIAETKFFITKKEAKEQFDAWLK